MRKLDSVCCTVCEEDQRQASVQVMCLYGLLTYRRGGRWGDGNVEGEDLMRLHLTSRLYIHLSSGEESRRIKSHLILLSREDGGSG